ncbi:MAG TPA: FlgD immunoglobulin-like domain containing protein [bacterium]|nr:FlgD immunoglobulin-like domain containing protein [bacterium]HPN34558.1 FlgD immunoglobulin-like domain containing protein [bacterium]
MFGKTRWILCCLLLPLAVAFSQPLLYTVEYGDKPAQPPSLTPVFHSTYLGFENVRVVLDNWYYASRQRADSVKADAFLIPGGSTSDVPFYDGSLNSYVSLLQNPGRPSLGFCAGLQFLLMARGGICSPRSGERGDQSATIFAWDEILSGCPNPYTDRAAHTYSIADLPDDYVNLASTRTCYVTFVRHKTMPLYGTQLHIERMSNTNSAGPAILANFRNRIMTRKFHGLAEATGFPGQPGRVRLTWWPAKTDEAVIYQVFYSQDSSAQNFASPQGETTATEFHLSGLDPTATYYFAVRALCPSWVDTNRTIAVIKPDGHRTLTFQNGKAIDGEIYSAGGATTLHPAFPNSNYGQLGAPGKGKLTWWHSGLVQFKGLERYLAGKKIIAGKVSFIFVGGVTDQTNAAHAADISIYRVLKPWNEGIGYTQATARTGEATWNSAQHNVLSWEAAGCQGSSDRTPEPIAFYSIRGDGAGIAFDGTVSLPADLLQTWVDHPDSNCGLLYEKVDSYPSADAFYFLDDDDDWFMNHPRLIVQYLDENQAMAVRHEGGGAPAAFSLQQNYPNPFNGSTILPIELEKTRQVKLEIHDLQGRLVCCLFDGTLAQGFHPFAWNGRNAQGRPATSGVYLFSLRSGGERLIRRMLLIR